ncbi:uncharacterized protein LOC111286765 [Durio zibethinus]|uniref:Uncharacterized protein LOC111286765 n=1 Tax=Durio zibethinus TaxID=66656 RepID=A0A6P5XX90_DURZI|nr:uncharacterized protein LOC111286765 [Durio zibethinus]
MSSRDSCMEGAKFNMVNGSERQERKSHHQLKYKSSVLCSNPFPRQNSSLNSCKGSSEKTAVCDCKRGRMSSKLSVERIGSDSLSNHPGSYGEKIANEQEKPWLHDDDNHTYKAPKNENHSRTSNLIHRCSEFVGPERGPSARMSKVSLLGYISARMLFHSEVAVANVLARKSCVSHSCRWRNLVANELKTGYPVRVKTDPTNELRVAKRVNVEFPLQDFVANASHARLPLLQIRLKGQYFIYFCPPSCFIYWHVHMPMRFCLCIYCDLACLYT